MFLYFREDAASESQPWLRRTGHRGWSFQFMRLISESSFGGGQFSEAHSAAERIEYGDADSWWAEWTRLARRLQELAERADEAGHAVTARDRFLRAGNYYRTAEFWCDPADDRKLQSYEAAVHCFRRSFALQDPAVEAVQIPYGDTVLPAYFARSTVPASNPGPAVVFFGGADTIGEELFLKGQGVLRRGMHLLMVEGPGQGAALRRQGLPMRHDWEVPAAAAYDYVAGRRGVDPGRVAIMALSLGGYLAERAAAFDHRFAACVAWGPHYDLQEFWSGRPDDHPLAAQWMWLMGADSMAEVRERLSDYRLGGLLQQIRCPTLFLMGQNEGDLRLDQGKRAFAELTCPKTFKMFTSEETGAEHCQADNLTLANEYIGDWLYDVLIAGAPPSWSDL